jgi:TPR repeat protein
MPRLLAAAWILILAAPAHAGPSPQEIATIAQFMVCEGDLSRGCEAFRAGQFEAAAGRFRELAEQDDAGAKNNLGVLRETGSGLPKSKQEALRWYGGAAKQGLAIGQFNLAVLLATGHVLGTAEDPSHRREDFVNAYMWLLVAAHQGLEAAERTRRDLVVRMTPEEVGQARERAAHHIAELEKK